MEHAYLRLTFVIRILIVQMGEMRRTVHQFAVCKELSLTIWKIAVLPDVLPLIVVVGFCTFITLK